MAWRCAGDRRVVFLHEKGSGFSGAFSFYFAWHFTGPSHLGLQVGWQCLVHFLHSTGFANVFVVNRAITAIKMIVFMMFDVC